MIVVFSSATFATRTDEGRASTVAHGSIGVHGETGNIEMCVVIENNFAFQNFDNYLAAGD